MRFDALQSNKVCILEASPYSLLGTISSQAVSFFR